METERITLSHRERDRLKVLHEVKQKHLSQVAAAVRLKVSDRQVRRMLLRIRERGDGAVVHGAPGRPANAQASGAVGATLGLGSGPMAAVSEIAISSTKQVAEIDAAPFLKVSYDHQPIWPIRLRMVAL